MLNIRKQARELGITSIELDVWSANALRSLLCDLQYFCPTQFPEK